MEDSNDEIVKLLNQSNIGWLLEYSDDRTSVIEQFKSDVAETGAKIASVLKRSDFDLMKEIRAEPIKLTPLIQLFTSPTTPAMRAMVYCALRGMAIKTIKFEYKANSSVSLDVTLVDTETAEEHPFSTGAVWDVEILRHLGIMTLDQMPVLHGFYAFD